MSTTTTLSLHVCRPKPDSHNYNAVYHMPVQHTSIYHKGPLKTFRKE